MFLKSVAGKKESLTMWRLESEYRYQIPPSKIYTKVQSCLHYHYLTALMLFVQPLISFWEGVNP